MKTINDTYRRLMIVWHSIICYLILSWWRRCNKTLTMIQIIFGYRTIHRPTGAEHWHIFCRRSRYWVAAHAYLFWYVRGRHPKDRPYIVQRSISASESDTFLSPKIRISVERIYRPDDRITVLRIENVFFVVPDAMYASLAWLGAFPS